MTMMMVITMMSRRRTSLTRMPRPMTWAAAAVLSAVAMTIVGTTVTAVRYVGGDVGSLAV